MYKTAICKMTQRIDCIAVARLVVCACRPMLDASPGGTKAIASVVVKYTMTVQQACTHLDGPVGMISMVPISGHNVYRRCEHT